MLESIFIEQNDNLFFRIFGIKKKKTTYNCAVINPLGGEHIKKHNIRNKTLVFFIKDKNGFVF